MAEGSTPQKHLLCTFPRVEPPGVLDRLRQQYPEWKFTYVNTGAVNWSSNQLDDDSYSDVTVLATLSALPSRPQAAPKLSTNHIEASSVYQDPNVTVTSVSGIHATTIAEWAIMMILTSSRYYDTLRGWHAEHTWGQGQEQGHEFSNLTDRVGKRLGIFGYGSIGRQVARVAKALGMEVIAYTASPRETKDSRKYDGYAIPGTGDADGQLPSQWFSGTSKEDVHRFLGQDLDYLLLAAPLTKRTRHILGREEFEILGINHTYLLNVGRGDLLVQEELTKALEAYQVSEGKKGIRGAALDVVSPEPLPAEDPLWSAPNLIITPHISGISQHYVERCFDVLEENLKRLERGDRLLNLVDKDAGYSSKASRQQSTPTRIVKRPEGRLGAGL